MSSVKMYILDIDFLQSAAKCRDAVRKEDRLALDKQRADAADVAAANALARQVRLHPKKFKAPDLVRSKALPIGPRSTWPVRTEEDEAPLLRQLTDSAALLRMPS